MSLLTPSTVAHLTILYSEPHRHYHNLSHVQHLLSLFETYLSEFHDPQSLEAAIWFHDAVYDPRAKAPQNEMQSAQLAVEMLPEAGVDPARVEKVKEMIEATAGHGSGSSFVSSSSVKGKGPDRDMALFLDMDLSILGAAREVYDEYERNVRKEYDFVSEEDWRNGRGQFLKSVLEGGVIFQTELFRGLFEGRARENIRRSLDSLAG